LPQKNHSYVIGIDTAKEGIDNFAIQVIDVTNFPFKQVASAKLQVDYLIMPEYIDLLGREYNEAFLVIENNEGSGQSVADILYMQYEYGNMYRDRNENDTLYKSYPGFRTTLKSRPLILNLLKIFVEEDKLIINDADTINELYTFTKSDKVTVKYEAEEGTHDDMVMALALCFAPFTHIKAFDDLELFLSAIHAETVDDDNNRIDKYLSLLDTGSFTDFGDDDDIFSRRDRAIEALQNSHMPTIDNTFGADDADTDTFSDLLSLRDY
jgi:hypothetical protein